MKSTSPNSKQHEVYKSLNGGFLVRGKGNLFKNEAAPSQSSPSPATTVQTLFPTLLHRRRRTPWAFPAQGIAVFHGPGNTPKLSHYFLPRPLLQNKHVLFLDGANSANPRLLARLARERRVPFEHFNRRIEIARAFTCFQLTELIARVPRFLKSFPADVLVVTALPDLYFDEDVHDWDARVAFEQALRNLSRLTRQPLSVAIFSAAMTFTPSPARKNFFTRTCREAGEVWRFSLGKDGRPNLICECKPENTHLSPATTLAR